MKKRMLALAIAIVVIIMIVPVSAEKTLPLNSDIILYEYTQEELDSIVFTMDMLYETFSREDIANKIALNKATKATSTYLYEHYDVTEAEIDEYYEAMERIALAERPLSYYFSNVYWRNRNGVITLTLTPTSAMKEGNPDGYNTDPAWLLVKRECENSTLWTNEGSLNKQFCCHAQGEILRLRGIVKEDIGDWDLEPHRPNTGYFVFVVNKCNPEGYV